MSRITRLTRDQVDESTKALYDKVGKSRGNVPNMFRVYAHRPELLQSMVAHLNDVTTSGSVPVQTKELVATLVSRINQCHY